MLQNTLKTNKGIKLWERAKKIIPGGNQLLSKRPEMFLPEQWPTYYKRAKGVEVWDLEDNHYFDIGIMGMSSVLGYANEQVNEAVKNAIDKGNINTLNCFEEVELAEKLIELHPWAQKVRFARTGGEACAIAVRIARAFTGKDKIAFCGYHGWSDWYLSANLAGEQQLEGQLLSGLSAAGVPKGLLNTAVPFHYGDIEGFRKVISKQKNDFALIIMEVGRNKVDVEFLRNVKKVAKDIGAVLIFDEITSGFRSRAGGMHTLYDIEPDMLILAKAMGNGYPIASIVGKGEVMEAAQETFISSSYWTERVGFVAALEVIKQFEEKDVGEYLSEMGRYIKTNINRICKAKGLQIKMEGLDAAPTLRIQEEDSLYIKTLYVQEMLKKGYLTGGLIFVSLAHTKVIVDKYFQAAEEVWDMVASAVNSGTLKERLEGPVCHSGFKRLT